MKAYMNIHIIILTIINHLDLGSFLLILNSFEWIIAIGIIGISKIVSKGDINTNAT